MDKPITFSEWLGTQGNMVLLHANCCRIAFTAGQQSMQAKVEELQKQNAWLSDIAERENKRANKLKEEHISTTILLGKVEQQKVELQKKLSEYIFVAETIDEMYVKEVQKSDEMQKRMDKALELMQKPVIVGEPTNYVCARFKELEQALKGEGQ